MSHISPRGLKILPTNFRRFKLFVVSPKITRTNDYNIILGPVTQDFDRDFNPRSLSHFRAFFTVSGQQVKRSKTSASMKKMHKICVYMRSKSVFNFIYILLYHRGKRTWLRLKPATARMTSSPEVG